MLTLFLKIYIVIVLFAFIADLLVYQALPNLESNIDPNEYVGVAFTTLIQAGILYTWAYDVRNVRLY